MALPDKAVDYLEQQIPELAAIATRQAYWQSLASGDSVLVAENGQIIVNVPKTGHFLGPLPAILII